MEIRKSLVKFILILTLGCCSNTPELETGEIKILHLLKKTFEQPNQSKVFLDVRNLLSRKQIDEANMPVLFVELETGQNGTLTPYPGQGIGQTWLGADGATITLERGIIKASRGMGDDIMGSSSSTPKWQEIYSSSITIYNRKISYLTGNNKISERSFKCTIKRNGKKEIIKIWDVEFEVIKFIEKCNQDEFEINNVYYLDSKGIVRQSYQYHSETLGHIFIQRLDR